MNSRNHKQKQCRVCRQKSIKCISLNSNLDGFQNLSILKAIEISCGIAVNFEENPDVWKICDLCTDELKITYIFTTKFRESVKFFNEQISKKLLEIEKVEFLEGYEQQVIHSSEGWDEIPVEASLLVEESVPEADKNILNEINVKDKPFVYKGITIKKPAKCKVEPELIVSPERSERPKRTKVPRKTYEEFEVSTPETDDIIEQEEDVDDADFVASDQQESENEEHEVKTEEHKKVRKRTRPDNKVKKEKQEIPFIHQKQTEINLDGNFAVEVDGKIMQKCNECGKMFPKLGSLRSHIKFVHLRIREWLCSMCPKMFVSKLRLEEHFRSHSGERPYKCEFCPMAFATPTRKKLHMIIHTGENPNVCKYCGKRFASYATLQGHIFIHTKQGVECNVCHKMFARAVDVKKHMAVHTQEKSFICKICNKGYLYATSLKSHMKNHTFEDVACKNCGASVSSLEEWNYHQQLHAKEIYECENCGLTFMEQHELYAHLRTAHVDIENLQKAKSELEMDKVLALPVANEELIETSGTVNNLDPKPDPDHQEHIPNEPITF